MAASQGDKSDLRLLREQRGLSRAALASAVGTTVHYVWHAEMPPFDAPPEIAEKIREFLASPSTPLGTHTGELRRAPRPPKSPSAWACPRCGYTESPEVQPEAMGHFCDRAKGKFVEMRRVDGEAE